VGEPIITKVKEERCESTSNFKKCGSHMVKKTSKPDVKINVKSISLLEKNKKL
jgi:hypothetical protein